MHSSKCPKCGGRVAGYDDYIGNGNDSAAATKIHVIACQICGWRGKPMEKKVEDIFTDVDANDLQECKVAKIKLAAAAPKPACTACGRQRKIVAKGLCSSCYTKNRKKTRSGVNEKSKPKQNEKLPQAPDRKIMNIPRDQVEQPEEIYIHFYQRDADLLAQLKTAAETNRRTLANEILWRLDGGQI